jgi:HK97 family phage major capsid protein
MENTEIKEFAEKLKSQIKDDFTKEIETKAEKSDIETLTSEIKDVKSIVENQSNVIKNLSVSKKSTKNEFEAKFEEKHKDILNLQKNRSNGFVQIGEVKLAGTMLNSGNITGEYPAPQYEIGLNGLPEDDFILRRYADVGSTTSNLIKYAEKRNRDGAATKQTEGSDKGQSDFDIVVSSAAVETYADFIKISNQMLNDVPFMSSEINSELMYQVGLVEETAIYTYIASVCGTLDNAGVQNKFVAGTSTYYDQLLAAVTQIRLVMKNKAKANLIALNPADIFLLQANVKDANSDYIVPSWVSESNLMISGIPVVAFDGIAAGTFLVADMSKLHIRDLQGTMVEVGFEMDDFTKNLSTIRGEKRFAMFIKGNDTEAFIIETFANAKAWIEA